MNPKGRGIGISLLALMTLFVALLALMLAFSLWLRGEISESYVADPILVSGLFLGGSAYGIQAYGLWTLRRWARGLTAIVLILVTVSGLLEAARNEVLALGTMLVFGLGFVCSIVALLATHPQSARAAFRR